MSNPFKMVVSFAIMALACTVSLTAVAQEAPAQNGGNASKTKRKAPPKVIELEELVVEGKIQKPEVFYVLGRAETRYKALKSRESFLGKIKATVEENPF